MWLMQALGFLLSALQVEEILKNLHSLISPYIQQLEKLAEEIVSELEYPCVVGQNREGHWGWSLGAEQGLGELEFDVLLPVAQPLQQAGHCPHLGASFQPLHHTGCQSS